MSETRFNLTRRERDSASSNDAREHAREHTGRRRQQGKKQDDYIDRHGKGVRRQQSHSGRGIKSSTSRKTGRPGINKRYAIDKGLEDWEETQQTAAEDMLGADLGADRRKVFRNSKERVRKNKVDVNEVLPLKDARKQVQMTSVKLDFAIDDALFEGSEVSAETKERVRFAYLEHQKALIVEQMAVAEFDGGPSVPSSVARNPNIPYTTKSEDAMNNRGY